MLGLKLKVLTSKAEPQMAAMANLEFGLVEDKLKGLKTLKIKGISFLLLC